jgi:hypothetical protein
MSKTISLTFSFSLSKIAILSRSFHNGIAKVTDQFTIKNACGKKNEGFLQENLHSILTPCFSRWSEFYQAQEKLHLLVH